MKTFLVERELGETPAADLIGMSAASWRIALQMLEEGDRIYYLGSTYLPVEGVCLCLFSAKNAEVVANHSRIAHLPVRRIADAVTFGGSAPPSPLHLSAARMD
jgi:Protein of unknown function (DUF4242)